MSDEEQPKSIDETLSEAFDKLNEPEEVEEVEEVDTEEVEEVEEEEIVAEDATPENPEPEPEVEEAEEAEEPEELADDFKHPPTTWRAEAKSKWHEVPNWLKEEVHKREKDSLNGVTSLKEKAQFADRLNQTIQPYQPLLNSMGVTPENAVRDALNLAHSLKTGSPQEKAQLLRNIAQQYEVDLQSVGQEPSDIEKAQAPLMQQIRQLQQQIQQQQASGREQQYTAAQQEVQNFAAETDEDGNLSHPYFENVRTDMQILVEAGRADTLQQAYDMACWSNPEIREILQAQQAKEIEGKRRAERAKKANSNKVETTQSEEVSSKTKKSIDDTLSETFDRLTAEG